MAAPTEEINSILIEQIKNDPNSSYEIVAKALKQPTSDAPCPVGTKPAGAGFPPSKSSHLVGIGDLEALQALTRASTEMTLASRAFRFRSRPTGIARPAQRSGIS